MTGLGLALWLGMADEGVGETNSQQPVAFGPGRLRRRRSTGSLVSAAPWMEAVRWRLAMGIR